MKPKADRSSDDMTQHNNSDVEQHNKDSSNDNTSNERPKGSGKTSEKSPYHNLVTLIITLLLFTLVTGAVSSLWQKAATQQAMYIIAITSSLGFFILACIYWFFIRNTIFSRDTYNQKNTIPKDSIDDIFWFFILILGITGVLFTFLIDLANNSTVLTGGSWGERFFNFIILLIQKNSYALFAVILVSILSDFVLRLFSGLHYFHDQIHDSNEAIRDITDKLRNLTDRDLKVITERIDSAQKGINDAIKDMNNSKDSMDIANGTINSTTGQLGEVNKKLINLKQEFLVWLATEEKEKEFHEKLQSSSLKKEIKDAMLSTFDKHIKHLKEHVSEDYLTYITSQETETDKYFPSRLASIFINNFISQFGEQDSSIEHSNTHLHKKKGNYIQANFGIMSNIVDAIYCQSDDIYQTYAKNNDYRVLYFTTLTMPINWYLNPREFAGPLSSVTEQWDCARGKTRKSVYHEKDTCKCGHMYRFLSEKDKYKFLRCCLTLDDDEVIKNPKDAIKKWKVWSMNGDLDADCIEIFDSALNHLNWIENNGNYIIDKNIRNKYFSHPQMMDLITTDKYLLNLESSKLGQNTVSQQNGHHKTKDIFIELYHPSPDDCLGFILSWDKIIDFYNSYKGNLDQAFTGDKYWHSLLNHIGEKDKSKDSPVIVEGEKDEYRWHELFFNRHIPVDIFAVGIIDKDDNIVKWLGCLGGYVGGDFNSMILAWHDNIISKDDEWPAIEAFMSYLYNTTRSNKDYRLSTMMAN